VGVTARVVQEVPLPLKEGKRLSAAHTCGIGTELRDQEGEERQKRQDDLHRCESAFAVVVVVVAAVTFMCLDSDYGVYVDFKFSREMPPLGFLSSFLPTVTTECVTYPRRCCTYCFVRRGASACVHQLDVDLRFAFTTSQNV
jgi:hypothetical protein